MNAEANTVSVSNSYTATYDPADDKLRLRALSRLPAELYERVKGVGFRWAPRQELFFAVWSPRAEDLLLELAGDIDDEDTSLVERAEERADRFDGYSERRLQDAHRTKAAVDAIADNIPFGQPILVGHHSEKRARRDAEKIENGMRKAVKLWETSKYWTDRAAGALAHAKYKERPDVRYRRIKTIESDKRKMERNRDKAQRAIKAWSSPKLDRKMALAIANMDYISRSFPLADFPRDPPASQYEGQMSLWSALDGNVINETQAREIAIRVHSRTIPWAERWIAHYDNRLAYERAMLNETGADTVAVQADQGQLDVQVGGRVLVSGEWLVVMKINRKDGKIVSVTTNCRYVRVKGIEEVKEYQPPAEGDAEKVKAATKLPPLCNFPGEGFLEMTKAQWDRKPKDYRQTRVAKATEEHGAYRYRYVFGHDYKYQQVYITDAKRVDPPAPSAVKREPLPAPTRHLETPVVVRPAAPATNGHAIPFEQMRESLRSGGVKVVSAPQLFPTPAALATRLVEEAGVMPGQRVLEPSAGTGNLVSAIVNRGFTGADCGRLVAIERNRDLCVELTGRRNRTVHANESNYEIRCADFLECTEEQLGEFDRIVMNPPFENGADVEHVTHALKFLKPDGRLVAIMSAGVTFRQDRKTTAFRELVEARGGTIEPLPEDSFKESGTSVRTVLVIIDGEEG